MIQGKSEVSENLENVNVVDEGEDIEEGRKRKYSAMVVVTGKDR